MKDIIIPNEKELDKVKKIFSKEGVENLHIISDFDKTLTKEFVNGERINSILSILRSSGDYLSSDYEKKAKILFEKYRPIENNLEIPIEEKKKEMYEWWTKHFELLIKSGLNKKELENVIGSNKIQFRKGVLEFIDMLYKKEIPLVIFSASGLGDAILILLEKKGRLYDNVHVITNLYKWDEKGNAISVNKPIIHSMNKDETLIKNYPVFNKIKNRKNVILLGDLIEDAKMVEGFDYDNIIKIGFLNSKVKENLESYKKAFDVVILNDSSMDYVNKLLKELF